MNNSSPEPEEFDVFLCHNSEDKPEIRRIADNLISQGIKPWLDEREIKPGELWESALENQISTIKSATVFVGGSGIGPWQNIEMRAFINEFVERKCPVIPAILASAKATPPLPILLKSLHYVDFHLSDPDPLVQLKWGITGEKPKMQTFLGGETNDVPALLPEKTKQAIEIRLPVNLESFSAYDKEKLLSALSNLLQIDGELKITATRPGSTRIFLELTPEDADKIYAAVKSGQLDSLGITQARLYPSLTDQPNEEQRSQLLILLNRVQEFWIDGVLKQSLHHEVLISLGKRAMDEAVEPPWNRTVDLPKQRNQLSLSNNRIETVFDVTGLLLILGEPGSGKTTTLLELVDTLIQRAKTDPKERIPIVLNLSSWNKQHTLAEWMADRLSNIYSVPRKLALNWLDKGYLIPLLDGLDEVKTEQQADCVDAINEYITQAEPAGLVVCCRLMEYQWLPEHLKLSGAICIEPLNREQIGQYFMAIGSEFDSLRMAIKEDTVLQELTQSPLMLNIMSMAYQSTPVENITTEDNSLETRRTQIFKTYVDKMFQRKGSLEKDFPKEKVISWLSWLAKKMTEQSQSVFFVENLQPSWLDGWKSKLTYRSISALIFFLSISVLYIGSEEAMNDLGLQYNFVNELLKVMLTIALPVALFDKIILRLVFAMCFGLISIFIVGTTQWGGSVISEGLMVGLWGAIVSGFAIDQLSYIKPIEKMGWSWKGFFKKACLGILVGILVGILSLGFMFAGFYMEADRQNITVENLISNIFENSEADMLQSLKGNVMALFCIGIGGMGIFFMAISWVIFGILGGVTNNISANKVQPNQGIKMSFRNGAIALMVTGFIFGLVLLSTNLMTLITYGLFLSLIIGAKLGLSGVVKHYTLRLVLWFSGKIPFKFIPFLDYCAKLILLKKVGGGYIFIHRMLLEYFASLGNTNIKSTKP